MKIDLLTARRKLGNLWFIYSGLIFFVFFLLVMYTSRFDNIKAETWKWFLPHITPTLLLIAGVYFADMLDTKRPQREIHKYFFRTAVWISVAYQITFTLVILSAVSTTENMLLHYQEQTVYLVPFQTLSSTAIGVFFSRTGNSRSKKAAP